MVHSEVSMTEVTMTNSPIGKFKFEKGCPLTPPPESQCINCSGCGHLILDRYYLQALDRRWHSQCLKCSICSNVLDSAVSCFIRNGKIYCKPDYYKSLTKCTKCNEAILPERDLVIRLSPDQMYHVSCFTCDHCHVTLGTGDYFGSDGQGIFCRIHYRPQFDTFDTFVGQSGPNLYNCESNELTRTFITFPTVPSPGNEFGHPNSKMLNVSTTPPIHGQSNNSSNHLLMNCINQPVNSLETRTTTSLGTIGTLQQFGHDLIGHEQTTSLGTVGTESQQEQVSRKGRKKEKVKKNSGQQKKYKKKSKNVESQNVESSNVETQKSENQNCDKNPENFESQILDFGKVPPSEISESNPNFSQKTGNVNYCLRSKRMRTSFKHHQLKQMKAYFSINHNPDSKELKGLSLKTGLSKRVLQVWFQNARAKWRRSVLRQESNGPHIVSEATSLLNINNQPSNGLNYENCGENLNLGNSWFYERHQTGQNETKFGSVLTEHFSIDSSSSTDILCEDTNGHRYPVTMVN